LNNTNLIQPNHNHKLTKCFVFSLNKSY